MSCEADLRLCFRIGKYRFSHDAAHIQSKQNLPFAFKIEVKDQLYIDLASMVIRPLFHLTMDKCANWPVPHYMQVLVTLA